MQKSASARFANRCTFTGSAWGHDLSAANTANLWEFVSSAGPRPRWTRAICREVLESLPEWFGIPASIESYVAAADGLPMLACFDPAGQVVGFVSVKGHTPVASEVYVMGIKRPWHRRGIGRALIEAVVELAISEGVQFLTVKTLSSSNDDPNYARTRLFYEAVGFLPIEEFPTLWGAENPCIFILRPLA